MLGNRASVHRFIDGYRGPLWRKSQLNGAWKLRYFVLEKKKVRCFADAACEKLVSEVTLFNDTTLYDVPGTSEGRSFLLYVSTNGTDDVYYLSAETEEEKYYWLEAMTDALHNGFKLINQSSLFMDPFYPSIDLCISYENSMFHASNSNKLKPQNVENPPAVELRFGHNASIYSLIMIDLDSVRADKDTNCSYLHWAIVNIEGTDIESGLEIASYESPAPEQNSGLHRYMFLLYDQASDFTPDQFELLDEMFAHRDKFSHLELMKQLHLGAPVGINGFYACWDTHCDVLHVRMQYTPLPEYFSLLQANLAETQRIENARATLFHDFVLGDIFPIEATGFGESSAQGSIALEIEYDNEYVVEDGQSIAPSHTRAAPSVSYVPHVVAVDAQGNPECNMYTLILVDPDAPSRINHSMREHVKWVVLNIPADSVEQGLAVLPYAAPDPAYASGLHRYVFALYKQKREFVAQEVEDSREFFSQRAGIISHAWVREQSDVLVSIPVGVEAFLSEWDPSVDDIHKASGYMPPPQYRSAAQKRAMIVAEGGQRPASLFSPKSGGVKSTEVDDIQMRLRKIQEAQSRFNSQVTENSSRTTALEISTRTSRANLTETSEESAGAGALPMETQDTAPAQEEKSTKRVSPRAPITLSSSAKAMNMSASQGSVNIGESLTAGSSSSASAAALLAANADDEPVVVSQQKETISTSTTNVSTAQRSETQSSHVATTSNVMESTVYRAGEQVSQERTEQASEQRNESHEEKMQAEHVQKVNVTQSVTQNNGGAKGIPVSVPKLQLESQELHEANDRIQRAMIYDQQQQAAEKQRLELEAQEEVRRVQKAEMQRQQQEVLERQKQEQERAMEQQRLQAQQLAFPPPPQAQSQAPSQSYSPSPRSIPRKQRSRNEFFGGIPDSEYSDTDASAYDSASVFSGPPQQSRYNYLQSQNSNSGILPSISSQRSMDENDEFSDTSGSFMAPRPPMLDASPSLKRPSSRSGMPPVDPVTRYKLIMEGIMQAKNTVQLCELFGVTTQTIFAGEKMKKKLSNDFMFKDSYLWIVPRTRSLHWSKGKLDAADSKYLLLDPLNGADPTAPPKGEMKGIVKRVRVSGPNLLITIESGDFLELKLSADGNPPAVNRATDWASVIKAYSQS